VAAFSVLHSFATSGARYRETTVEIPDNLNAVPKDAPISTCTPRRADQELASRRCRRSFTADVGADFSASCL
jgi:hypothetical protein